MRFWGRCSNERHAVPDLINNSWILCLLLLLSCAVFSQVCCHSPQAVRFAEFDLHCLVHVVSPASFSVRDSLGTWNTAPGARRAKPRGVGVDFCCGSDVRFPWGSGNSTAVAFGAAGCCLLQNAQRWPRLLQEELQLPLKLVPAQVASPGGSLPAMSPGRSLGGGSCALSETGERMLQARAPRCGCSWLSLRRAGRNKQKSGVTGSAGARSPALACSTDHFPVCKFW